MRRIVCLAIAWAAALGARGEGGAPAARKAPDPHRVVTQGREAQERIARVRDSIAWAGGLEEAFAQARRADKPVFWLQLVGNLDGEA